MKPNNARGDTDDRPAPPRFGQRNAYRLMFSKDHRNNPSPSAFQQPRVQQQAPNALRSNGTAPMAVDMAQQRGPHYYACEDHAHVRLARECNSRPQFERYLIEGVRAALPKISTRRPANRWVSKSTLNQSRGLQRQEASAGLTIAPGQRQASG